VKVVHEGILRAFGKDDNGVHADVSRSIRMTKGEWNQIVPLALVFSIRSEHQTQLEVPAALQPW